MGSTTAHASGANKRTLVLRKNTGSGKSTESSPKPPSVKKLKVKKKAPTKPSVEKGPFAVKTWKSGKRTVARFFVAQWCGSPPDWTKKNRAQRGTYESKWYVMDMDSGKRARGSNQDGYDTADEARKVAKEYRNKYGAYTEVPY